MLNVLTVQSVSNSRFYSSSGDQHIHNNFFANAVDSNLDGGELLTCFAACEPEVFPLCFLFWLLLLQLVVEQCRKLDRS
jgi:hypothetical protein